jgi:hypothetical protein
MQIVIKTWDKDIYFLSGYDSAKQVDEKLSQADKVELPTGTILKTSAIRTIMPYEDYKWQQKQKRYHKRNEYLKDGNWHNDRGVARPEESIDLISGKISKRIENQHG